MKQKIKEVFDVIVDKQIAIWKIKQTPFNIDDVLIFILIMNRNVNIYLEIFLITYIIIRTIFLVYVGLKLTKYEKSGVDFTVTVSKEWKEQTKQ